MPGTTEPVEVKADDVAQETVALTETAAAPSVDTGLTAEEEARVGELLGRIFGVENGWDAYNARCDADGNITRAAWDQLFPELGKQLALSGGVLEMISIQIYGVMVMCVGDHDGITPKTILADILSVAERAITLFSSEVFRFLDSDGSGTISRKEFAVAASLGNMVADPETAIAAIFRMLDENGNGTIEPFEGADITVKFVNLFYIIGSGVIDELKKLVSNDGLINKIFSMLRQLPAFVEKFPDGVFHLKYEETIDEFIAKPELAPMKAAMIDQLRKSPPRVGDETAEDFLHKIRVKFDEIKESDGTISKQQAVSFFTENFMTMYTAQLTKGLADMHDPEKIATRNAQWSAIGIPEEIHEEFAEQFKDDEVIVTSTFKAFFAGGGAKRYIEAAFNLLDTNNDGRLHEDEMFRLVDPIVEFHNMSEDPQAGDRVVKHLFMAIFAMFDHDSDGILDEEDIKLITAKFIDLFYTVFQMTFILLKQLGTSLALPMVNHAFYLKSKVMGGTSDELTLTEVVEFLRLKGVLPPPRPAVEATAPAEPQAELQCSDGHPMRVSAYAEGPYGFGFGCDRCRKFYPTGVKRWLCLDCHSDVCLECSPATADVVEWTPPGAGAMGHAAIGAYTYDSDSDASVGAAAAVLDADA